MMHALTGLSETAVVLHGFGVWNGQTSRSVETLRTHAPVLLQETVPYCERTEHRSLDAAEGCHMDEIYSAASLFKREARPCKRCSVTPADESIFRSSDGRALPKVAEPSEQFDLAAEDLRRPQTGAAAGRRAQHQQQCRDLHTTPFQQRALCCWYVLG
jgi:hypothetical protein